MHADIDPEGSTASREDKAEEFHALHEVLQSEDGPEVMAFDVAAVTEILRRQCHRLLRDFPAVRRWDQTDDIVQQSALRLVRAMQTLTPHSQRHLENLAALQVRRTLIDLGRKYTSSVVFGARQWTPADSQQSFSEMADANSGGDMLPEDLERWLELHESIGCLPLEEREVFELIWYQGFTKPEVAKLLNVDLRTVQRRWRSARERLLERHDGAFLS